MLPPGTMQQIGWHAWESLTVELTREAILPADAPISKSMILGFDYDHCHVRRDGDEINFRLLAIVWSVLYAHCGEDLRLDIDFLLCHYISCDADPRESHHITSVGCTVPEHNGSALNVFQPITISSSLSDLYIREGRKSEIARGSSDGCHCKIRFDLREV